jgi:hypothetical protein
MFIMVKDILKFPVQLKKIIKHDENKYDEKK